jgi:hypothetical protein
MAGYKEELEARVVVSNWMSTRFTLKQVICDFLVILRCEIVIKKIKKYAF